MKFISASSVRRDILRDVGCSVLTLLLSGWLLLSIPIQIATLPQRLLMVLLLALGIAVAVHLLWQFRTSLQWHGALLDSLPMPAVYLDRRMVTCYENKAAKEAIGHDFYRNNPMFREIPEGFAITETLRHRVEYNGTEHALILTPIFKNQLVTGYILTMQNIHELLENYKSRAEIISEINRLLGLLNSISLSFSSSTTALARCTQRQAETLYSVASIINSAISSGAVQPEDMEELRTAAAIINRCIAEGGARAGEISQVAGDIADVSHSLTNTVKIMKNVVG